MIASVVRHLGHTLPAGICILLVLAYQAMIRPFLIGHCRYCPSCSEYALQAFRTRGAWQGLRLTLARLGRCHPLSRGGYDPVPQPDAPSTNY